MRLALFTIVAGFALVAALAWTIRAEIAHADEPSAEVTALRSQVANLAAALYLAEGERCPNLGVVEVPPARKGARK